MNPTPEQRFAPHLRLAGVSAAGHAKLRSSRVLLIGIGGLGCAAAPYLAGSGVGQLTICDFDTVAASNLARQTLFGMQDCGQYKADVAANSLSAQFTDVAIQPLRQRADPDNLPELIANHDMVLDASDNYGSRLAINQACLAAGRNWVMGSCIRMEGQLKAFTAGDRDQACYRCVYGQAPETLEDCPGAGIFAPVAGIIGAAMAQLALSRLAGLPSSAHLHLFDGHQFEWTRLATPKDPACPACASLMQPA